MGWNNAQGPELQAKSSYRFIAHSFLPILSLVAAEQAARAGVTWAGWPSFQGGLSFGPCLACKTLPRQSVRLTGHARARVVLMPVTPLRWDPASHCLLYHTRS